MRMRVEFKVLGQPRPAGSKRGFPVKGRDGKLHVAMSDTSGHEGKVWRLAVVDAARQAWKEPPPRVPVSLRVAFVLPRPKAHYGTRGLKPAAARLAHTKKPDVLKLTRAVEDALTGILWCDDSQVISIEVAKRYGDAAGIAVLVESKEDEGNYEED